MTKDLEEFILQNAFEITKNSKCVDADDLRTWMQGHVRVPVEVIERIKDHLINIQISCTIGECPPCRDIDQIMSVLNASKGE